MSEEERRIYEYYHREEFSCGDDSCPYNINGYCMSETMQNSGICYTEYCEEMAKQGA